MQYGFMASPLKGRTPVNNTPLWVLSCHSRIERQPVNKLSVASLFMTSVGTA